MPDSSEAGERFGSSLAAGDLDGDGYADLAAGVRTFSRNQTGISLDGPANVDASTFRHNTRDGLYAVDGSTPVLKDNLAVHNHRYGLYAPSALDVGGNKAHDNGKADCIGVSCTF